MAKVSPMTKASLTTPTPKPANQGGHAAVNVQPAKIQAKAGSTKPGPVSMNYSKQPAGIKGTNPGAK
jgi:hypothetical protein